MIAKIAMFIYFASKFQETVGEKIHFGLQYKLSNNISSELRKFQVTYYKLFY